MTSGGTGIRLVKCPKCYKLLPEDPNVPVYRCGGCGTILRAKIRTTSGETATAASNQGISTELSEKDSSNDQLSVLPSSSPVLHNDSGEAIERKSLNSTDQMQITRITEKSDAVKSENTENLSHGTNSNVTEDKLKEEHVESRADEPLKENRSPLIVQHINDRSKKREVRKKSKEIITSSSSEDFQTAQSFTGLTSNNKPVRHAAPKDAAAAGHRRPPKSPHSYEFLQADILSKVDKLRKELVDLFGKAPAEIEISNLLHAEHESNRYRRVRVTPQECTHRPHPHQNRFHPQSVQPHVQPHMQPHGHGINRRPQFVPKNHCRPILVGAPFVICSNCFNLIQIPADFNVSRKRLRKLQCGNCSAVLLYSYRAHPYNSSSRDTTPLTPSESGDTDVTPYNTDTYRREERERERISISEEYGISFGISRSTDPDAGPPLHVSRNSSFYSSRSGSGRETRTTVGSRLHQIMGYESASEILFRQNSDASFVRVIDEAAERERKGKAVLNEQYEIGYSRGRLKRYNDNNESPKRSGGIHEMIKKGIIKFKPSLH